MLYVFPFDWNLNLAFAKKKLTFQFLAHYACQLLPCPRYADPKLTILRLNSLEFRVSRGVIRYAPMALENGFHSTKLHSGVEELRPQKM